MTASSVTVWSAIARDFGRYQHGVICQRYGSAFLERMEYYGAQALRNAIAAYFVVNVRFLLERGALQYMKDSLILVADCFHARPRSRNSDVEDATLVVIFKMLLAAGADPLDESSGQRLLHASIGTPFFNLCLPLCKSQVTRDEHGQLALLLAFGREDVDTVVALKRLGAPRDCYPRTSMHDAPKLLVEKLDCSGMQHGSIGHAYYNYPDSLAIFYLAGRLRLSAKVRLPCPSAQLAFCIDDVYYAPPSDGYSCNFLSPEHHYATVSIVQNLTSRQPLATTERPRLHKWSLYILLRFAFDACIGLAPLDLPALLTETILRALIDRTWPNIADYHYNLLVVAVKHFRDAADHPAKRRLKQHQVTIE